MTFPTGHAAWRTPIHSLRPCTPDYCRGNIYPALLSLLCQVIVLLCSFPRSSQPYFWLHKLRPGLSLDPDALPTPNCLQFLLPSREEPASSLLLRPCLLPRVWLISLTDRFKVTLSPGSFPPGTPSKFSQAHGGVSRQQENV